MRIASHLMPLLDNDDPSLSLGGFSLRVHGRQFPESDDYWDGNWVIAEAEMRAPGASIRVAGPILHLSELSEFIREMRTLRKNIVGTASLSCIAPNLNIQLTGNSLGHIQCIVAITADHLSQSHKFTFDVDQTYVDPIIDSVASILKRYPVRRPMDADTRTSVQGR
jgi:hypothetical protein